MGTTFLSQLERIASAEHEGKVSNLLQVLAVLPSQALERDAQVLDWVRKSPVPAVADLLAKHVDSSGEGAGADALARQEELRNACTTLRLHLVASSLGLGTGPSLPVSGTLPEEEVGTAVHRSGGLVTARVGEYVVCLLPAESSESKVEAGFLELATEDRYQHNWIVDFSAIQKLRWMLVGAILSHQAELEKHGKRLSISWLREASVPESERKRFTEKLKLFSVGGNLFSVLG